MQLDFEEATKLLGDNEVFVVLMQIAIFAVLSQLDGMPPVRLFEAREADTRNSVLFCHKKPFEGLREAICKHLYRGGWNVFALPFECGFKLIFAWEGSILLILCRDRLKHPIVNDARLSQARHELAGLLCIHEQAVLKGSHAPILLKNIRKIKRQGNTQPQPQIRNAFLPPWLKPGALKGGFW
jgi:hypothetical protein